MRIRSSTRLVTGIAMCAATIMIAQHIAGKATRDTLFLTYFDVSQLPKVMMVSALVSIAAVLMMSRLLTRFGPARLIPPLYLGSAVLLIAQWYLAVSNPKLAAVALYLHVSALNSILISGFWSLVNERFDPHTAKRVVPRLTAAATFGGLLGGIAANAVASAADTNAILLMLGAMHLLCGAAVGVLARGHRSPPGADSPSTNIIAPLKRNPLIRRMALLALLVATTAALLDYILKAEASANLSDDELITFFSYFYMAVGLGTFLVQSLIGDRALRWLGLGGTMAAWPLVILVSGTGALLLRSLATATLMRASANLLYNSFFRSGFELLYTPIAASDKRAGKILIDVGADRSGDLLGGLVVLSILLVPVATETLLVTTALVLAALCLALILVLHRGYVRQLADNLRSGQLRPESLEVVDATTAHTVATTQTALQRDRLLREIAETRGAPPRDAGGESVSPGSAEALDPVARAIIDLRSKDESRMRRVLTNQVMTPALLPHVIPLLADERVLREALRAVRRMASTGAGQIVDALLDPMQHPLVRRRLPLILARSDSSLAVDGLITVLDDPDWNVRFRCAQALEEMHRLRPRLRLDRDRLLAVAEREAHALSVADRMTPAAPAEAGEPGRGNDTGNSRLRLLFLLFGALYDPETIDAAWHALLGGDRGLRGTALEYLENRLPDGIWTRLERALGRGRRRDKRKRPVQQAARELLLATAPLRSERPADPGATDEAGASGARPAREPDQPDETNPG